MNSVDTFLSGISENGFSLGQSIIASLVIIIITILISALLGLVSARLIKLSTSTYKKSIFANLCYFAINVIINLVYLMLPSDIQSSIGLSLFNCLVGFLLMSYFYAKFFNGSYKQGMLVTLIAAAIAIIAALAITFLIKLFM